MFYYLRVDYLMLSDGYNNISNNDISREKENPPLEGSTGGWVLLKNLWGRTDHLVVTDPIDGYEEAES